MIISVWPLENFLEAFEKTQQVEKTKPIRSEKVFGRNTKVSVRYEDGTVKKDIKFKKVENDINSEKCVILED